MIFTTVNPQSPEQREHAWRQRIDAKLGTNTHAALTLAAKGAEAKRWLLQSCRVRARRKLSIQHRNGNPLLLIAERFGASEKAPKLRMIVVQRLKSICTAFVPPPDSDVPVIVKRPRLSLAR
jgi:hypothetical protein